MRVLVTAFGPFPGVPVNPTQAAVTELGRRAAGSALPGIDLATAVLPVDFAVVPELVAHLIDQHHPDVVLCTGVSAKATAITVERVAVNLVDARVPDATGAQPVDLPVVVGAPDGLLATIPVKAVRAAIRDAGVPAELSLSAGTYGCNAAMFAALHHAPEGARAGFLHIPPAEVMDADRVADALVAAVLACARHETDLHVPAGELA